MPQDMQAELWRGFVSGTLIILLGVVAYVTSVLSRMKREQDARAVQDEQRDVQRAEVQENVRRIMNGNGVALTEPPLIAVTGSGKSSGSRKPPDTPPVSPPEAIEQPADEFPEAGTKPDASPKGEPWPST